ncbi:hypothetical protein CMT41_11585 [Colwellia sp. MT41]|uniref:HD domain-containing protein n=1 Tax=Colwellia sp. MT41 TaxID=58049 RepID=UPI0007175B0F|nr:hypothetical protein [Colwellia sp. MT41]ALO35290.1 hypothetical protein CMT41_11585 [Colwellia sp. MT41]
MNLNLNELEPLEEWLKHKQLETRLFPNAKNDYFDRYWAIKKYLASDIYAWIGAGTSAEDKGIYTDHSIDHFNAVVRYAGHLLKLDCHSETPIHEQKLPISPYETFITLVSILLHDAGNIEGRRGHEKAPLRIFTNMGLALCPNKLEASPIATIARAHGGKVLDHQGEVTKDTIEHLNLKDDDSYGGIKFRPKLIAALVRFADEICEDHSRAARYLLNNDSLPKKSEVFHHYANSIKSVEVDLRDRSVKLTFQLDKENVLRTFGKDNGNGFDEVYLIDEINERLEKMFCELNYCKKYMYDLAHINRIKAVISIYDEDENGDYLLIDEKSFELKDLGYPQVNFSFKTQYPKWCGEKIKEKLKGMP